LAAVLQMKVLQYFGVCLYGFKQPAKGLSREHEPPENATGILGYSTASLRHFHHSIRIVIALNTRHLELLTETVPETKETRWFG